MDCSIAESLYSINDEIAAEAAAYVIGRGALNVQKSNLVIENDSQSSGTSGKRITGNVGTVKSNQRGNNREGSGFNRQPARRGDENFLSRYGSNGK